MGEDLGGREEANGGESMMRRYHIYMHNVDPKVVDWIITKYGAPKTIKCKGEEIIMEW